MTPTPTPEQVLGLLAQFAEAHPATPEHRQFERQLLALSPAHLRHLANHVTSCSALHSGCALADNPLALTEQQQELERLRAQVAEGERLAQEVRMAVLGLIHDIRHRPELPNGLTETYVLTLMGRLEAALGTAQAGAGGE